MISKQGVTSLYMAYKTAFHKPKNALLPHIAQPLPKSYHILGDCPTNNSSCGARYPAKVTRCHAIRHPYTAQLPLLADRNKNIAYKFLAAYFSRYKLQTFGALFRQVSTLD